MHLQKKKLNCEEVKIDKDMIVKDLKEKPITGRKAHIATKKSYELLTTIQKLVRESNPAVITIQEI